MTASGEIELAFGECIAIGAVVSHLVELVHPHAAHLWRSAWTLATIALEPAPSIEIGLEQALHQRGR